MRIFVTKSGISFGSTIKLVFVGHIIGMVVFVPLIFIPFIFNPGFSHPMPGAFWFMIPLGIAGQSLFTALIVTVGIKIYEKIRKLEILHLSDLQNKHAS